MASMALDVGEVQSSLRLQCPFSALIVGPTNSGKTELVKRLIMEREEVMSGAPDRVIWCYGVWQRSYKDLFAYGVKFIKGVPSAELLAEGNFILVVDDLMHETRSSESLAAIFTKYSHHSNITCIYLLQNLFPRGLNSRNISINATYIILMKNMRDKAQIAYLARQVYPGRGRFLTTAFQDATREPYTYLLLDFAPKTPDVLRVRAAIFPTDEVIVYKPREQ
jgi:hypothetical protein